MTEPPWWHLAQSGEMDRRAEALEALLSPCRLCPRACGALRDSGQLGVCRTGPEPAFASAAPHFGEEPPLSGTLLPRPPGLGNVFFTGCNLACLACQNASISQGPTPGAFRGTHALADACVALQDRGCHAIGFVSPTHQAPGILRALAEAGRKGLRIPVVWNSNAWETLEMLRVLDGIVDVYLPDLKYADDASARLCSGVDGYVATARSAILEMARQVGVRPVLDERGLLRRGLLIRLLVLPNGLAGVEDSLAWIASELGTGVALSVMSQYWPAHRAAEEPLLSRSLHRLEWDRVLDRLDALGFEHGWVQPFEDDAAACYRPDFDDPAGPFPDAADWGDGSDVFAPPGGGRRRP
ncbi:MAG: radical SAM protein [Deltaproteobacteria bacterium]|nr:radical SAM protein [Deltaproteobacteria bacterium]